MSDKTDKKLADLLKSAQKGDRYSLDLLCKELEKVIRGYFWQKFQNKDVVDDLSQETYLRLYHNLLKVREPMKLRGFVVKIAIHVSQDYLRQKYRKREETLEYFDDSTEESSLKQEKTVDIEGSYETIINNIDLEQALTKLSEKSRQILFMKIDGFKYEEISKKIGISVSGVKMQVQRSLELLRENLADVTILVLFSTILLEQMGCI